MIRIGTLTKNTQRTMMISRLIDNSRGGIAYLHNFGLRIATCFLRHGERFSKECLGPLSLLHERGCKGQCTWHLDDNALSVIQLLGCPASQGTPTSALLFHPTASSRQYVAFRAENLLLIAIRRRWHILKAMVCHNTWFLRIFDNAVG